MASFLAGSIAKGAFNLVAKDRNILIPLDNIQGTKILTDTQLKTHVCPKKPKKRKIPKTNMEKIYDRL